MRLHRSCLRIASAFIFLCSIFGASSAALLAQYTQASASSLQDTLITLSPSTENNEAISINVTSLPASGTLYDLSDNYVNFGYSPVRGIAITSVPYALRSGSTQTGPSYSFRVVYAAPAGFAPVRFSYQVINSTTNSSAGIVEITSADQIAVQSSFLLDNQNWNVVAASTSSATWSATSVGSLTRFIYGGTQGLVLNSTNSARWYFKAPAATYARDNSALYNGVLQLTLAAFEGDFSTSGGYLRSLPLDFVTLICASCNSGSGITLSQRAMAYYGDVQSFSFTLNELPSSGWLKDPRDIRVTTWSSPTACEFVSVLRGLSEIRVYGDWTTADEVVGMDGFTLKLPATQGVPVACY